MRTSFTSTAVTVGAMAILVAGGARAAEAIALRPLYSTPTRPADRTFLDPQGLAFDPSRFELYVADTGHNRVVVMSKNGVILHTYQHTVRSGSGEVLPGEPAALLPRPGGKLALTDRLSDRIDLVDYMGNSVGSIDVSKALGTKERASPGRLAGDVEGNLYVIEQRTARVLVFDAAGKLVRSFGGRGGSAGRFEKIADVAVGENGTIYVLDSTGAPVVTAFDSEGHWLLGFGRHGNKPETVHFPVALTIDGGGRIWIADAFSHEVKAYTPKGEFVGSFGMPGDGPGQFYFPSDVVAFADVLYVLEKGGRRVQAFHIETARPVE